MRTVLFTCALSCVALSAFADGDEDNEDLPPETPADNLQPATFKYTAHVTTPETLLATPDAACAQWAAFQAAKGYHHSFVKVVPSTETGYEGSFDCVFKNQDWNNEQWTQAHGAEDVPTCPVKMDVISVDGSGSDASQRCKCHDEADCPAPPAPAPAPTATPDPGPAPTPEEAKKFPFAPDTSKRCKQSTKSRRVSERAAKTASTKNKRAVQKDPKQRKWAARYNKVRDAVEAGQQADRGKDSSAFPDFGGTGHLCENGGPTDVNIGLLCGSYSGDFAAANNLSGYTETPSDAEGPCTWHHHEELGRMVLVKRASHQRYQHWGGVSIWKRAFGLASKYPK